MTYREFFDWCESRGLTTAADIGLVFDIAPITVEAWRARARSRLPRHVELMCLGLDSAAEMALIEGASMTMVELRALVDDVDALTFAAWCARHGMTSLARVGDVFGKTKQAVHLWNRRGNHPSWLGLACLGFERQRRDDTRLAA